MPGAPRPKGKAKKIAFRILGIPSYIKNSKSSISEKDERRIQFEESFRTK